MEKPKPSQVHLEAIDDAHDAEERTLMDPLSWDWDDSAELRAATDRLTTFELTFDRAQLRLLSDAATAANMPVGRWIKQLALAHAELNNRQHGSAAD